MCKFLEGYKFCDRDFIFSCVSKQEVKNENYEAAETLGNTAGAKGVEQREKEDEMTSFLDSHQSAAAVNKKLRFETSHEPILVIL